MTNFVLIHDDSHDFLEGMIDIPYSSASSGLSAINKAYIEITLLIPITTIAKPSLLGFLYQFTGTKRSKPYAVVSQQQSITLDFTVCDSFVFIPTNRLIDAYDLKLYVANDSSSIDNSSNVDLSSYALKSYVDTAINNINIDTPVIDLSIYATNLQLTNTVNNAVSDLIDNNELIVALQPYALLTNIPIQNNNTSALSLITISANQVLEVNKYYFVNTVSLELNLPTANLSIGDCIRVYNGVNSNVRITHGNSNQKIKNNNTDTLIGVDNGIILKPYSCIELVYIASSNLWVSTIKIRTVNNWQVPIEDDSVSLLQSYTATAFGDGTTSSDYGFNRLYDGNLTIGYDTTTTANVISCIVDFGSPKRLVKFDYWNGFQGGYLCSRLKIYAGSNKSDAVLKDFHFAGKPISDVNIFLDTIVKSRTYVFEFYRGSGGINFAELKLYAPNISGGEIVVS